MTREQWIPFEDAFTGGVDLIPFPGSTYEINSTRYSYDIVIEDPRSPFNQPFTRILLARVVTTRSFAVGLDKHGP
jgi:hypothetical protein